MECPCGKQATKFISVPRYGFGGDPAYGSFRNGRCDDCAPATINHPEFKGMKVIVEDLAPPHPATETTLTLEDLLRASVAVTSNGEGPVPVRFPKPLSDGDARFIKYLFELYEGTDTPLVKFETDQYTTVAVPRIRRVFATVAGRPA